MFSSNEKFKKSILPFITTIFIVILLISVGVFAYSYNQFTKKYPTYTLKSSNQKLTQVVDLTQTKTRKIIKECGLALNLINSEERDLIVKNSTSRDEYTGVVTISPNPSYREDSISCKKTPFTAFYQPQEIENYIRYISNGENMYDMQNLENFINPDNQNLPRINSKYYPYISNVIHNSCCDQRITSFVFNDQVYQLKTDGAATMPNIESIELI
jgi:hypothetical protein